MPNAGLEKVGEESIGPAIGQEIKWNATKSLLASFVIILIYVAFRFEFGFGIGAVVASVHDIIMTIGIFVLPPSRDEQQRRLRGRGDPEDKVEQRLKTIAEREAVVTAVRREVEAVHEVSARSREDLDYLAGQRDEVARLRKQVQQLLDTAADTEAKIAVIEARRRAVDEVQSKSGMIANLLLLTPTLYMLQLYDRVLKGRSELTLIVVTLLMVFLFAIMVVAEWLRSRLLVRGGVRLDDAPEGKTISQMLVDGEIDAFMAPRAPALTSPNVGLLFFVPGFEEEFREVKRPDSQEGVV